MLDSITQNSRSQDLSSVRSLSEGQLQPLGTLVNELGIIHRFRGEARFLGSDPIIQSPHRLGEASGVAQLAIGAAAAALWNARTGQTTDVSINIVDALHYLHPTHFVRQQGRSINVGAEHVAVNDIFLCRDGRYLMLEAGPPYAKLLKGYSVFFDCGDDKQSYAREVAKWNSLELEEALADAGLPACRAFTRAEWLEHPQGQLLARTPVVEIEKIAEGPPVPFPSTHSAASPLEGFRVLDFTHVLAGPRSARTLAEYGADVLHISSPSYADTLAQHLGVDVGKRCAYLDLRSSPDLTRMHQLAQTADVFTTTYRGSVNRRFGLDAASLAARSERGIICMTANAYGHAGPWRERPGFDQNGQVVSGFAAAEGGNGKPKFSPVFYLADLMTGYLAAAGMMAALLRRAEQGGSYHVKLSLARSAMWVQEFGLLDTALQAHLPISDTYPAQMTEMKSVYGNVSFLAPPLKFSNLLLPEATSLEPYGAGQPAWQETIQHGCNYQ
ncbi:CoA transferase [Bradyrhizobium elkanii]|uniref:Crotonobetainyl-CoA:carnitine CoA-transferase CaiB-like acyl-CoA transferase n=1 Tax=Bradyrhizobium elkanii TaxID=29448 RepID=A0A8I1YDN9_BRAEL|nr:CoA transferase [Bradyrhizobium elkanii]MBP1296351.1 crotonobetainyl-CoA:carnitine CoA-transferase CaiB-like acyl-CoA transferase [Bradyrhizobium elkanii]